MSSVLDRVAQAVMPHLFWENWPLMIAVGVPVVLGSLAGFSTLPQIFTWYQKLRTPWWTPPAFVIGQTWAVLYVFMGVASYLVWLQGGWAIHSTALTMYVIQLGLNLAWQLLFFLGHRPGWAQVENLVLFSAVSVTTFLFFMVSPLAGLLMVPYLMWTGLANALNFSIWQKNPSAAAEDDLRPSDVEAMKNDLVNKGDPGTRHRSNLSPSAYRYSPSRDVHDSLKHSMRGPGRGRLLVRPVPLRFPLNGPPRTPVRSAGSRFMRW